MGGRDVSEIVAAGGSVSSLSSVHVTADGLDWLIDGAPTPSGAVLPSGAVPAPVTGPDDMGVAAAAIEGAAVPDVGAWLSGPVVEPSWLLRVAWQGGNWPVPSRAEPGTGVLRQGIVALLAAAGGSGKSQLLVQLLLAVTLGRRLFDRFDVSAGGVGCVWGEEDAAELHRRMRGALGTAPDAAAAELLSGRLRVLPARRMPVALLRDVQEWRDRDGVRVAEVVSKTTAFADALGDWLTRCAPADGYRLVVLDPSARFAPPAAETDNAVATRYVEVLERLTGLPGGPTVLLAHHTAKGGAGGQGAARGASALVDGARFMWLLQRAVERKKPSGAVLPSGAVPDWLKVALDGGRRVLRLSVEKTNYGSVPFPVYLEWHGGRLCPLDRSGHVERGEAVE